jgi:hypothetical protein
MVDVTDVRLAVTGAVVATTPRAAFDEFEVP